MILNLHSTLIFSLIIILVSVSTLLPYVINLDENYEVPGVSPQADINALNIHLIVTCIINYFITYSCLYHGVFSFVIMTFTYNLIILFMAFDSEI